MSAAVSHSAASKSALTTGLISRSIASRSVGLLTWSSSCRSRTRVRSSSSCASQLARRVEHSLELAERQVPIPERAKQRTVPIGSS